MRFFFQTLLVYRIGFSFPISIRTMIYYIISYHARGGARGVMVIVVGYEHSDTSSNPGRDWLHFT